MKTKMTDKHKLMAYVLNTDVDLNKNHNITQKEIAKLFNVSQSTIATAIKEAKMRIEIDNLTKELSKVKGEVLKLDNIKTFQLPDNIDKIYKRKL